MREISSFPSEQLKTGPLVDYKYNDEPNSDGRLVVFFPGVGTNMGSQDRIIRRHKSTMYPELAFNSVVSSLTRVDKPFTTEAIAEEITGIIKDRQASRVIFFGSSFGAACAISTAQYFNTHNINIPLDAIIALVPCVNEESVHGMTNILKLIRHLPEPVGIELVRLVYAGRDWLGKLKNDSSGREGSLRSHYHSIKAIPKKSDTLIGSKTSVHAFFSPNDEALNNGNSLADLEAITDNKQLFTYEIPVTGTNNHNLRPEEFINATDTYFLPLLNQIWSTQPAPEAQ